MSLVTLIPAYKPKYLGDLLLSLWQQSVKPGRVVVSDDSPQASFTQALADPQVAHVVAGLHIEVVRGPCRGSSANWQFLTRHHMGDAEFFHLLLDDDVIYPGFYERHLQAHALGHFPVTVSRRWTANESGMPLRDLPVPVAVAQGRDALLSIDAPALFASTCARGSNWLGETSNAVYRAGWGHTIADPQVGGISYIGLDDIGSFLRCTLDRPVLYINDHLGYFRTSPDQNSAQTYGRPLKLAHLAYIALSVIGHRAGQISAEQLHGCVMAVGAAVLHHYGSQDDLVDCRAAIGAWMAGAPDGEARFLQAWQTYAGHPEAPAALPLAA